MKLQHLAIIGWIFGAIPQSQAQGYIVPNGVTFVGWSWMSAYEVQVLQETNGNYTGFTLRPEGKTPPTSRYINTFSYGYFVDEGVRVFLVPANAPISLQPILSQGYAELGYPGSYVFESGIPFYLGLYTGPRWTQYPATTPVYYSDPMYGWAKFVNNRGVIEMLDSALAYNSQGIYAGTRNFVPEPGVFGLAALGGGLFGLRRWRKRRTP